MSNGNPNKGRTEAGRWNTFRCQPKKSTHRSTIRDGHYCCVTCSGKIKGTIGKDLAAVFAGVTD